MSAPERIWAFYAPEIAEDENGATIVAHETVQHGGAPYVRADLAAAQIEAARRDAWAEAMKAAKDNVSARCVGVCDFPDACRCELADRIFPIPYPGDAT